MLSKFWRNRWYLISLPKSLYFNFHYLPFMQAIKLPILLWKVELIRIKGDVIIDSPIKTGMIRLGYRMVGIYKDDGLIFANYGGTIIFKGECKIGNSSAICVNKGELKLGNNFIATASLRLACYKKIEIGNNVLLGWDCMISDTDFHQMKSTTGQNIKCYGSIRIGDNCWFASRVTVLKNTLLPSYVIVASNSLLNKVYDIQHNSLLAGQPAKVVKQNVYRDYKDDAIQYS